MWPGAAGEHVRPDDRQPGDWAHVVGKSAAPGSMSQGPGAAGTRRERRVRLHGAAAWSYAVLAVLANGEGLGVLRPGEHSSTFGGPLRLRDCPVHPQGVGRGRNDRERRGHVSATVRRSVFARLAFGDAPWPRVSRGPRFTPCADADAQVAVRQVLVKVGLQLQPGRRTRSRGP